MYLEQLLGELSASKKTQIVFIPSLWKGRNDGKPVRANYIEFLSGSIEEILRMGKNPDKTIPSDWSKSAVVYNIFVRFFTAYDHNGDGKIGSGTGEITINKEGIRETGTFLKTLALLPYLEKLGINTIHLLPITSIGLKGRKGDLGSPYAIKNPFEIDANLADPVVEIPIENQYKALIEAAHRLGMRVVQEFIFRTAAIDSDWTKEYPEWFYWIKKNSHYSAPEFRKNDLKEILKIPGGKGRHIPPNKKYRALFAIPNRRESLTSKIASAFADWPPHDLQPPWTDVTYLRLYNFDYKKDNNFNYIAYNTIRYYDPELAQGKNINHELWEKISGIIPYFQKTFGIDGAMIDMGHALPHELKNRIIRRAHKTDPDFAFWDENFDNKKETKADGYNAVIGNYWHRITKRNGFGNIIREVKDKKPLPQFGTAETHNSPRHGYNHPQKKKASWLLFNLMPDTVPFMHNGFELNEVLPVNTGLNFTKSQIEQLSEQSLPLFYKNKMNWDVASGMVPFAEKLSKIKKRYPWIFDGKNISLLKTDNRKVLGFEIVHRKRKCFVLFNTNFYGSERFAVNRLSGIKALDLIPDKIVELKKTNILGRGRFLLLLAQ
ncbi:MAG: alpha-amylase family glycosyl hydrolase [Cytophagales bacterium]|nr:alpha-amylase family glycosyl hydrolase [Cytophagales bacterium]